MDVVVKYHLIGDEEEKYTVRIYRYKGNKTWRWKYTVIGPGVFVVQPARTKRSAFERALLALKGKVNNEMSQGPLPQHGGSEHGLAQDMEGPPVRG